MSVNDLNLELNKISDTDFSVRSGKHYALGAYWVVTSVVSYRRWMTGESTSALAPSLLMYEDKAKLFLKRTIPNEY